MTSPIATTLPPCGVYRTTAAIGEIPKGRLVYFHNHGEPGPGVYLPRSWHQNRAEFSERGMTLEEPYARTAATLLPLPPEGFYRVNEPFYCCEKKCTQFGHDLFVQLGYDADATPLLFLPKLTDQGIAIPDEGNVVSLADAQKLLPVVMTEEAAPEGAKLADAPDDEGFEPPAPAKKRRNPMLH